MTQDEIIEFTKRSGLGMLLEIGGMDKCLEHFAKIVAAKEREACAKMVDHIFKEGGGTYGDAIRARGEQA